MREKQTDEHIDIRIENKKLENRESSKRDTVASWSQFGMKP